MNNTQTAYLQAWLNDVIVRQGDMSTKLQAANYLYKTTETELIANTRNISIYSRLHVYTSGYIMRLQECLSADFPVLENFLGKEVFEKFSQAALVWSPSTSYSLYNLGEKFIHFLEATQPRETVEQRSENLMLNLPLEIARVERARQTALRAKGLEHNEAAQDLSPEIIFLNPQSIKIKTPDTLRLLMVKFALIGLFSAFVKQEELPLPEARTTFMAVSRYQYRLQMLELTQWQYQFLNAASEEKSLMELVNTCSDECKMNASEIMAELVLWLPVFANKGFIAARLY